jgi:hypothetical protein
MTSIRWVDHEEGLVGKDSPVADDVLNRALRDVLEASGVDPDVPFDGFATAAAASDNAAAIAAEATARAAGDTAGLASVSSEATARAAADTAEASARAAGDAASLVAIDAARPQGTRAVATLAAYLDNNAAHNVKDYGAVGDANPDTGSGTDDTAAILAAITAAGAASGHLSFVAGKQYRYTAQLDFSSLKRVSFNGAVLHRTDAGTDYAVQSVGTVGTYRNLSVNASRGANVIVSATLAAEVRSGDLIKIISDALFATGGTISQGEMVTVHAVLGSNIYLRRPLQDTYLTSDTARAALVHATELVWDAMSIKRYPVDLAAGLPGVFFQNMRAPTGRIRTVNCTSRGIIVNSCYEPSLNVSIDGSYNTDPSTGYGLSIDNTTMWGQFFGVVSGARHAVKHGGAPAYGGVPWGNQITVIGANSGAFHIFDAHEDVGSVFFHDCIAEGGSMDDSSGSPGRSNGWQVGARYVDIRDCVARNCGTGIALRNATYTMEELRVRNFDHVGGTSHAVSLAVAAVTITSLDVDGVRGSAPSGSGGTSFAGLSIAGPTVTRWSIARVKMAVGTSVQVSGSNSVPSIMRLIECESGNGETTTPAAQDSNWRAFRVGNTNVKELYLINCRARKVSVGVNVSFTLDVLDMQNCQFETNWHHVMCDSGITITNARFRGGHYLDAQHNSGNRGVIFCVSAVTVATLEIIGVRVTSEPFFHAQTATNLLIGPNQFPASFDVTRVRTSGFLEHLAGGPNFPIVLRGNGSPESAVTAPIGTLYLRKDGGASTVLYIKESGTGNTGWVAK